MATSTVYEYSVTATGGSSNYKVTASTTPPSGTLDNATLSAGTSFSLAGVSFTYMGGADQNNSGKTDVGFFASNASGTVYFFSVGMTFVGNNVITENTSETFTVCFLRGTRLAAPQGETAVEDLRVGDLVATRLGGETVFQPITWIGHRSTDVEDPGQANAYPVRIRANAFGNDVPHRDLLVTPEHCIFVDGKLIPARMLVNGSSIIVDTDLKRFEYFHVELERHSILISEGLETESYLATGNRGNFSNALVPSLRPDFTLDALHKSWERDAAAPLAVDRETVEPVWRRLMERAIQLGFAASRSAAGLTGEPDLRLVTNSGLEIRPTLFDGRIYAFVVPGGATSVRLVSRASRPSDTIGPFVDDRRELGVLVGAIGLNIARRRIVIDTHQQSTLPGWHALETGSRYRWTTGDAVLPVDLSALNGKPAYLDIEVIQGGPYLAETTQADYGRTLAAA